MIGPSAIALSGTKTELAVEDLLPLDSRWRGAAEVPGEVRPLRDVMREAEVAHIRRALEQTGGHRSQTADLLGISRKVLWEKMRDFGIEAPSLPGSPGSPGSPGAPGEPGAPGAAGVSGAPDSGAGGEA